MRFYKVYKKRIVFLVSYCWEITHLLIYLFCVASHHFSFISQLTLTLKLNNFKFFLKSLHLCYHLDSNHENLDFYFRISLIFFFCSLNEKIFIDFIQNIFV